MKLLKMLAVCAAAGTFTGCAIDYSQIVDHPAGAKPQDTISVSMINIVTVLSNSSRLIQRVTRDSLHVAMGLPQGWSVVSADCYIAEDTRLAKMIGSLEDTAATVAAIQDSMTVYYGRRQPMTADPGMAGAFAGESVSVTFETGDTTIHTDAVGQWIGFSASANLDFPLFSRLDTAIAVNSDSLGLDSLGINVDSVGFTAIPVALFIRLKAPAVSGTYPLIYFSKTGALPATFSNASNPDAGSFSGRRILVDPSDVRFARAQNGSRQNFSAVADQVRGAVVMDFTPRRTGLFAIDITSLDGRPVWRYTATATAGRPSSVCWDGRGAPRGTYLVRYEQAGETMTAQVRLIGR